MKNMIFPFKSLIKKSFPTFFTFNRYFPLLKMQPNLLSNMKRNHSELSDSKNSESNEILSKHSISSIKDQKEDEKYSKKVCLQGLDTFSDEKKFLKYLKANFPNNIKIEGIIKKKGKNFAFILFETIDDRNRFEQHLTTTKLIVKNKKLTLKPAKTTSYHTFKKLHTLEQEVEEQSKKIIVPKQQDIDNELSVSIQKKVCPLWETPYNEQIAIKKEALSTILKLINTTAKKSIKSDEMLPKWLENRETCCNIDGFLQSENIETNPIFYYRNKAELTIGKDHKGNINVGFNRGSFNKGIMWVEEAKDCPIISKEALKFSNLLQEYIRKTNNNPPVFERFTHLGFWRNLVIRQSNNTKEILISVVVSDKEIEKDHLEKIKKEVKELFLQENLEQTKIVGILMLFHNEVSDNIPYNCKNELLYGEKYYTEKLLSKSFQISPDSFLQVNTPQAEKLYSLIGELANIDENTIFLDICSGIGTIGICLAEKAKQIIAIEVVESACQDALKNAENNSVKNFTCHCAKVEDIIEEAIKPYIGNNKIVGVLDPPRAGLHGSVIKKLRTCKGLDKLIYVSCNPNAMVDNLMGLCLPMNKNRKAPPFSPIKCYGVDLFPLTEHYECVMVLERLYNV